VLDDVWLEVVFELCADELVVCGPLDPEEAAIAMTTPTVTAAAMARTTGTIGQVPRRSAGSSLHSWAGAATAAAAGTAATVAAVA
jgi:hypothetical protein